MLKMIKKRMMKKLINLKNMMINQNKIMMKMKMKKALEKLRKRQTNVALCKQKKMKKERKIKKQIKNDYFPYLLHLFFINKKDSSIIEYDTNLFVLSLISLRNL